MPNDGNQTKTWQTDIGDHDFDAIARVASRVQLTDVRLKASTMRLNTTAEAIPEAWSTDAFIGFNTTVQGDSLADGQFNLNAFFSCVYKGSWKDEVFDEIPPLSDEDPPEIEVHAEFELIYRARDDANLAADDLSEFARANGTLHAWPYWRELAESAAQRMGVPRLVVGVFKIPSTYDPRVDE